jgi:NAD(P)-dependent dehydrogenase (short-subunit alcohol dehydrogenase family)
MQANARPDRLVAFRRQRGTESFAGGVAVVTGAGSGIGRATARLLAQLGAKVHCADLDIQSVKLLAQELRTAVAHQLDVTDAEAVEAFAERVFDEDGVVDILHNNAGIGHAGDIEHTTFDDWRRVIDVNLLGVAYGIAAFVPRMLNQGSGAHIVNTASGLGLMPAARMAPYCASKFGVVGMSESLNAELEPRGIHVTALCPGVINTSIGTASIMRGGMAARQEQAVEFYRTAGVPPEEVAEAVVDAIRKRKLIQPVPVKHVAPGWLMHRISPRFHQSQARKMSDMLSGA